MALTHKIYQRAGSTLRAHHLAAPDATPFLLFPNGGTIRSMSLANLDDNADVHFKFWNQADEPDLSADYPHMTLLAPRLSGGTEVVNALYEVFNTEEQDTDSDTGEGTEFLHFSGALWCACVVGAGLSVTSPDVAKPAFATLSIDLTQLEE